jgi:hypothetical protein
VRAAMSFTLTRRTVVLPAADDTLPARRGKGIPPTRQITEVTVTTAARAHGRGGESRAPSSRQSRLDPVAGGREAADAGPGAGEQKASEKD